MTFLAEGARRNSSRCVLYSRLGEAGFRRVDGIWLLLTLLYGILPCMARCFGLPHPHPNAIGSNVSAFAYRPEDDLHAPDQIVRRHVADLGFHAAVGGVVAVVAHHEIVAGGNPIFLGVVVEP